MKKLALHWQVIIGLILGTIYAYAAVHFNWVEFTLNWINPFGDIFINLLKMIAVPLVLFSVISGIISLQDITKLGRMGMKTLAIYLITTMFAVSLGLLLVNLIKPGEKVAEDFRIENRIKYELWKVENGIMDLDAICLSCDPVNAALVAEISDRPPEEVDPWVKDKLDKYKDQTEARPLDSLVDVFPSNIFNSLSSSAMLQIIFFAVFFGIIMVMIPKEKSEPVAKLIDGLNEVFIQMVWVIMKAMPIFVFALMAGQVVKAAGNNKDKFQEILTFLGWYSLNVVIGLGIMIFLVYPLIAKLFARLPIKFFLSGIKQAQLTAFSTSSSVATLPVTMDSIENKLGVSKPVTSFVLPIGATVNMDGTSLYQAVAVVALAQYHLVDLSIAQQLVIVLTATLASIGAAAIPSAGLVLMMVVLTSVGLNPLWIAIIFPVDRILDMCRTVVNVTGDATVASLVAKSEGELNPPAKD